jgi:hypothetical protein
MIGKATKTHRDEAEKAAAEMGLANAVAELARRDAAGGT